MFTFEMISLQYFANISVQISPSNKNWIFSKSTQNGLLKNAQDGISTPIGSREIQNTKVYTVLWNTLYIAFVKLKQTISRQDYISFVSWVAG